MIYGHKWAFNQLSLLAIDLEHKISEEKKPSRQISPRMEAVIHEVDKGSIVELTRLAGLTKTEILDRFAAQGRCFAVSIGGEMAAYGWVAQDFECIGELERGFTIPAGDVYIWDCFTLPKYRRRRLFTALLGSVADQLVQEGFRRVWIGSLTSQKHSLRGMRKAGFQPVLTNTYIRLYNTSLIWMRGHRNSLPAQVTAARQGLTKKDENIWGDFRIGSSRQEKQAACIPDST